MSHQSCSRSGATNVRIPMAWQTAAKSTRRVPLRAVSEERSRGNWCSSRRTHLHGMQTAVCGSPDTATADANVPYLPCRHACYQLVCADVPIYDTSSRHHRVRSNLDATQDGRVSAKGSTAPDNGRLKPPCADSSRMEVIGEYDTWANEHLILKGDTSVYRYKVLNLAASSDNRATVDVA